jgi:hypothetical protein
VKADRDLENAISDIDPDATMDITRYLNAEYTDPVKMQEIASRLQAGEMVALRDAFKTAFAEITYREICSDSAPWSHNEAYFPDGYAYKHSNIFDQGKWTDRLNKTFGVFSSDSTKAWAEALTQRDCSGVCVGAPSLYRPGDHSLPHTDWAGQRTVAFVWHLSKDWLPEWGGSLYWARNHHNNATYPASFNTLVLFGVATTSAHFVTTVSPHSAPHKRLTFNGWWQSSWMPRADTAEDKLDTKQKRSAVTHSQLQALSDMLTDKWTKLSPEKRERLSSLKNQIMQEFYS